MPQVTQPVGIGFDAGQATAQTTALATPLPRLPMATSQGSDGVKSDGVCWEEAKPQKQSRLVVARRWEEGRVGETGGYRVSLRVDGNVLELDGAGGGCTTLWIYQKPLSCILEKGDFSGM